MATETRPRRSPRALLALAALAAAVGLGSDAASSSTLALSAVRAGNGGVPYQGDRPRLVTVSPNGDGLRDWARVAFRLARTTRVTLQVSVEGGRAAPPRVIYSRSRRFHAGAHSVRWTPPPAIEPRTYRLRVLADGRESAQLVVRVLGVEAAFGRQSYEPGANARLVVSSDARRLLVQLFQAGPETRPNLYSAYGNDELFGIPAGSAYAFDWARHRNRRFALRLRLPEGPSGLYFARLVADDGRVGFAPFVLLPRHLGSSRVAVVFPTNTWQAYNHRDVDGDGIGDTWYSRETVRRIDLTRPYLHRGVPTRFRGYELGFLRWLHSTNKQVDFVTDRQLDRLSGRRLQRLYDLVVFLGHHEYMTRRAYDHTVRYRDLGGNLMFTSTTNFLWRVARHGHWLVRGRMWRALGRPEASLIGVQFSNNDGGKNQGHYLVVGAKAAPWAFRDTGLADGGTFGHGGIEIDARTPASPPGTIVLATMRNLQGGRHSAEMTYYGTAAGAKVFAAGTLNFAGTALETPVSGLLENLWRRLARP